jgi:hypothetical protein
MHAPFPSRARLLKTMHISSTHVHASIPTCARLLQTHACPLLVVRAPLSTLVRPPLAYACLPRQPFASPSLPMHALLLPVCTPPSRARPLVAVHALTSPMCPPLDLLEILAWKSTSILPMPCQFRILMGGKI